MTCKDCGKEISNHGAIRCKSCYNKNRTVRSYTCPDCGDKKSPEAARCKSCDIIMQTGRKLPEETRRKMAESTIAHWDKIGRKCENRHYYDYEVWRKDVFEHDDYTCQHCDQKGGQLNAHHMEDYDGNPELRTELSNGITLCKRCHKNFHHLLGRQSTRAQVFWFLKNVKLGKM